PSGDVVVKGATGSSEFPTTAGAYDTERRGPTDLFIARFDPDLTTLRASTLLGGSGIEGFCYQNATLILDGDGNVIVTGGTDSSDFPVTPDAYATTGSSFVSRLSSDLTTLQASTYVPTGGGGVLALDGDGNLLVTSGGYRCSVANPGTGIGLLV